MHYLYSILAFIGMILFASLTIYLLYKASQEKDQNKSKEANNFIVISSVIAVGCFFGGTYLWNQGQGSGATTSANQVTAAQNTNQHPKDQESSPVAAPSASKGTNNTNSANSSSSNTQKFSADYPVPDSYLKDFLSDMDTMYKYMHDKAHSGEAYDQGGWAFYLSYHERDGWEKYNNINYQTSPAENEKQSQKRIDVEHAWIYLSGLGDDYDLFLGGKSSKTSADIQREETQCEQAYQKAEADLK